MRYRGACGRPRLPFRGGVSAKYSPISMAASMVLSAMGLPYPSCRCAARCSRPAMRAMAPTSLPAHFWRWPSLPPGVGSPALQRLVGGWSELECGRVCPVRQGERERALRQALEASHRALNDVLRVADSRGDRLAAYEDVASSCDDKERGSQDDDDPHLRADAFG